MSKDMDFAPIVLLTYRRIETLKKVIKALQNNCLSRESMLIIYSDGPASTRDADEVRQVREYLISIKGFASLEIHLSDENLGLARSVKKAVSETFQRFEKLILLEDDILCSSDFLEYMNQSLQLYEHNRQIFSITGYRYPFDLPGSYSNDIFLMPRSCPWGWATWRNRWSEIDWSNDYYDLLANNSYLKNHFVKRNGYDWLQVARMRRKGIMDVWSDYWNFTHFKFDAYSLAPVRMKSNHIGYDHYAVNERFGTRIQEHVLPASSPFTLPRNIAVNQEIMDTVTWYFRGTPLYNFKREVRIFTGIDMA